MPLNGNTSPYNSYAVTTTSQRSRSTRSHNSLPYYAPDVDHKFPPRNNRSPSPMSAYTWWKLKRLLSRPLIWIVLVIIVLMGWWGSGSEKQSQSAHLHSKLKELLPPEITKELQFFPASHHRIHYVGRWTTAPNRLRIDGAFPGVYFDLNVTNTSSLVLSLQNTKDVPKKLHELDENNQLDPTQPPHSGQFSFSAASRIRVGAPPISLLALVDQEEYIVLPNATGLSAVRMKDLDANQPHSVRIIAPMTDNGGKGIVQLDGLWLDKGGQLLPVEGSIADTIVDEMDDFDAESDQIGAKHELGLGRILRGQSGLDTALKKSKPQDTDGDGKNDNAPGEVEFKRRKKLVEIVTDDPANFKGRKRKTNRSGGADGLLAGVMGWEYLLGEMFSVDHVSVGVEGQCLIQDCVGGTGSPAGLGDVFFRSGPVDSAHFGHPWPFQSYAPDVLIFNLGASDFLSVTHHAQVYNETGGELFRRFEDSYVSLIKATRTMAYPNHPATIEMQRLGVDAYEENMAPATIPIFIMRPFGGELEWASQGAVNRLRGEGDKGVFWLDTSGWLDFEGTESRSPDVFWDPPSADPISEDELPPRYHLTERGNQKVSIYLHMHTCRYLASAEDKCAFLPPEVYQGQIFDASVATFERYIENEKERQIREMFWTEDDENRGSKVPRPGEVQGGGMRDVPPGAFREPGPFAADRGL